jgi:nicotinate phosphoribosyltransferase
MTETNRWTQKRNLTMLTDFYELTMANGYLKHGMQDKIAYFDMFFRKIPDDGGYAIMAGLEQMIEYLNDLVFTERDIAYLKSKKIFSDEFLDYLKNFKFSCDVWAVPEGTLPKRIPPLPRHRFPAFERPGSSP